ncbi:MAG: hypothetical protein IPN83_23820 [Holophagales bacterium]|nr:hypothetical protein [Holophagales bacterium]
MTASRERVLLLLLVGAVLGANLLTAARYPAVWVDEIQFADPAVNFVLGNGFTSSVWVKQGAHETFAGNAPLYPVLLAGWLSVFGVSATAVRSLNYVLVSLLSVLVHTLLSRSERVRSAWLRLGAAALVLTAHGMTFSYRMGRYDTLGMVWLAVAALLWDAPRSGGRLAGLFAVGLLLAPTGLQLVPATILLCGLAVLFRPREDAPRAASLLAGLVGGVVLLRVVLGAIGTWDAFRASTGAVGVIGKSILGKILDLPRVYSADKSLVLLALAALLLLVPTRKAVLAAPRSSLLLFGVATLAVVPSALQVAAKFPLYYSWMAFLPLLAGVTATLGAGGVPRPARAAALALLVAAAAVGLPLRLAAVTSAWDARDPARLENELGARLASDDVVVGDFKGYYVVKARSNAFYGLPYLGIMTPSEKESVTALVLKPEAAETVMRIVGGTWAAEGADLAAGSVFPEPGLFRFARELRDENYPLRIYRRVR